MLIIEMKASGSRVADVNSEAWAKNQIAMYKELHADLPNEDMHIKIANGVLLAAFRVLIKEGVIDHKQVKILFNGDLIDIDKNGTLRYYPVDFDMVLEKYLYRLIDLPKNK